MKILIEEYAYEPEIVRNALPENRLFLTKDKVKVKVKEKHAGLNKISWLRTIARTPAVIGPDGPVYLQPVNKKRTVDFDEELLVIYYSILAYIHRQYGFRVEVGMGYELITGDRFRRYLDGYGMARLRQIKYKYFSDRDLMLWELCFAFFDRVHQANIAISGENYLLAKDFERVFEAMIDELLGDEDLAKYKELSDGKELDHLYVDDSEPRNLAVSELPPAFAEVRFPESRCWVWSVVV